MSSSLEEIAAASTKSCILGKVQACYFFIFYLLVSRVFSFTCTEQFFIDLLLSISFDCLPRRLEQRYPFGVKKRVGGTTIGCSDLDHASSAASQDKPTYFGLTLTPKPCNLRYTCCKATLHFFPVREGTTPESCSGLGHNRSFTPKLKRSSRYNLRLLEIALKSNRAHRLVLAESQLIPQTL